MTGFGKFANILNNPSTYLVRALPKLLNQKNLPNVFLAHSEIVTVSIQDCDETLDQIYAKVKRNLSRNQGSKHIVINFGVAASRKEFSLETIGKNIKDFRVPDERGNQPLKTPIETDKPVSFVRKTTLEMQEPCSSL